MKGGDVAKEGRNERKMPGVTLIGELCDEEAPRERNGMIAPVRQQSRQLKLDCGCRVLARAWRTNLSRQPLERRPDKNTLSKMVKEATAQGAQGKASEEASRCCLQANGSVAASITHAGRSAIVVKYSRAHNSRANQSRGKAASPAPDGVAPKGSLQSKCCSEASPKLSLYCAGSILG